MDPLATLKGLYEQRDKITERINEIGTLMGLKEEEAPAPDKPKRKRGPNKPKPEVTPTVV